MYARRDGMGGVIHIFKRLIIPYSFVMALWVLFFLFKDSEQAKGYLISGILGNVEMLKWPIKIEYTIHGMWFLLTLFWAKVFIQDILRMPENLQIVSTVVIGLMGYFTNRYFPLPWCLQNAMVALPFVYVGFLCKKYNFFEKLPLRWVGVFSVMWLFGIKFCGDVHMHSCDFQTLLAPFTATCGSFVVIFVSRYLEHIKILSQILAWFGKMSMVIYCMHIFEIHTELVENFQQLVFSTNNGWVLLVLRISWGILWGMLALNIKPLKKIFLC